ncbi:two-component system chemotaxis response regulator CheB [Paenibacillus phyllosphaerae]|uniref:Protein-glutamate methylesterase/protein-glutamine glutaminase n=1 Tax=Paenibacillus phyllosphaerae TaxID=274593 RepID=A0A7W5B3X4_9BACL|nr:chemotaxis response regulator protein-glutamate methylesterase [Paenibacillus phyllosphaerae]MBB3113271.1 two-component system chemotaxis response regulator CheB [Paenibacillus phyllosphaerae]
MKQYGVLIVDDSAFMRRAIGLLFEQDPQFYVVGIARNGEEAVEKAARFKPDVITMDIEMPEVDGIAALEQIMLRTPCPVVMLSTQTGEGTVASLRALELGAVDFFLKSTLLQDPVSPDHIREFLQRVKAAASARLPNAEMKPVSLPPKPVPSVKSGSIDLVVIGTSTGGPSALQTILPRFPADFSAAVIVVQHMPPGFTKPLADRFDGFCQLSVKEAEEGDVVKPGIIYIAPAGFQTVIAKAGIGRYVLHLESESDKLYKPSVDVTLASAAVHYGDRLLTAVLTGMGNDGLEGCQDVKANKGHVLVEAECSCIVYGMPKVVFEAGLADQQAALPQMYDLIRLYV